MGYGDYGQQAHEAITQRAQAMQETGPVSAGAIFFDIVECLRITEEKLGLAVPWRTCNAFQAWLMEKREQIKGPFPGATIHSEFSQDVATLKTFFLKWDMKELADKIETIGPDEYVAAVVAIIASTWDVQGEMTKMEVINKASGLIDTFIAAQLPEATIYDKCGQPGGVVSVKAGPLTYFFAEAGALASLRGPALFDAVQDLVRSAVMKPRRQNALKVPFVDARVQVDEVSALKGMRTLVVATGQGCKVVDAGQMFRFLLTHRGALTKVGSFVMSALESTPSHFEIRETFVVAITAGDNHQLVVPIIAAPDSWVKYTPEAWKQHAENDVLKEAMQPMDTADENAGTGEAQGPIDSVSNDGSDVAPASEVFRPENEATQTEGLPDNGGLSFTGNPGMCVPPGMRGHHGSFSSPGTAPDDDGGLE